MKAERAQAGSSEGSAVTLRERGAVQVAAGDAGEHDVVIVGEEPALAEARENLGDSRRHRNRPDPAGLRRGEVAIGVARADADRRAGEIDVSPPEGDELALAQAGERR